MDLHYTLMGKHVYCREKKETSFISFYNLFITNSLCPYQGNIKKKKSITMAEKGKLFLTNSIEGYRYRFCIHCQPKRLGFMHLWAVIASK